MCYQTINWLKFITANIIDRVDRGHINIRGRSAVGLDRAMRDRHP